MRRYAVIAVLTVCSLALLNAAGQEPTRGRESLRGLTVFSVWVEPLSPDGEAPGFPADQLSTEIERRLRDHHITVIPYDPEVQSAYLSVDIWANPARRGVMHMVHVQLKQPAMLLRTSQTWSVTTWESQLGGTTQLETLHDTIIQSVSELLDGFIEDYLAVNPD